MEKVAFHNLGCKVNAYEMELMLQNFRKNGYEIVPFSEKADVYIINTCTVTNIADRKSRQMLHRAKSMNPEAVVVAAGCYVETDKEGAAKDESIDLIISNKDKPDILKLVRDYLDEKNNVTSPECSIDYTMETFSEHTRAYIKIQDGCEQFCSYCIIPYSRGRVVSRSEEDILQEITRLSESGYKEFVLTGIHLSSYGLDRAYNQAAMDGEYTNHELIDIIEKVAAIEGVKRVRLGSLEPRIITEEFLERMAALKEFCPHFHLSLQSGSDSVLKRMNRRYDANEYYDKTVLIRKYFEHPALTTDVIVGFPGETEEEFEETREYLNRVNFYEVHVFKYSRRHGTVADKLPGQLTEKQKAARSKVLIEDSNKRKSEFAEYYIGKTTDILIEEPLNIDGVSYQVGYNREYVRFALVSDKDLTDEFYEGKGTRVLNEEFVVIE